MEQAQQVLQDDPSLLAVPLFLTALHQEVGDRLHYLFLAPGWSHDGPDKRAQVMRRQ